MSEMIPTRFGIIGCGTASVPVCEAIATSPLTEFAGVYDLNPDLARDISQRYQVPQMETLDELINNPMVDAVYIAVPHYLLATLTRQTLQAGKHALTEKPLAISLEDVDALIALAAQRQLALGVFYEMRYAPAHAPARELIQAGAIGNIIGVRIQTLIDKPLTYWQSGYAARSINPWRGLKAQAGGGIILMNTSHLLDALAYITGLLVTSVSAEIGNLISNVEVEDMAAATLRFNNGAIGSLIAGAHISGAHNEECCHLYGTEGQVRLPDPYGKDPLQIYLKRPWGEFTSGQWHSIPTESVSVYQRAVEAFAQAVQSGQCAPINGRAARYVLSVVRAIYQSAAERRTVSISLGEVKDARH
jgi:UDP-N-acetyl-2-amino-2-deoxyglucuronate dehydrogenase